MSATEKERKRTSIHSAAITQKAYENHCEIQKKNTLKSMRAHQMLFFSIQQANVHTHKDKGFRFCMRAYQPAHIHLFMLVCLQSCFVSDFIYIFNSFSFSHSFNCTELTVHRPLFIPETV